MPLFTGLTALEDKKMAARFPLALNRDLWEGVFHMRVLPQPSLGYARGLPSHFMEKESSS